MSSMFVGNTFVKVEEVRGKYIRIDDEYDVEDIVSGEEKVDGILISKSDFENIINNIYSDVISIIKTIKNYDTFGAIDELEILAEKLY